MKLYGFLVLLVVVTLVAGGLGCAAPAPAPKPSPAPSAPAAPPASAPAPAPKASPAPAPSPTQVAAPKPETDIWPKVIRIESKPAGVASYNMAVALFKVIESENPGRKAQPAPSATSAAYPRDLQDQKVEFAIGLNLGFRWAMEGQSTFKDKPATSLRTIGTGSPYHYILGVRPDSGIKKLADIKGKNLIGNQLGSETVPPAWRALLAAAQLTDKDVNFLPFSGSSTELVSAITEKRAHGQVWYVTPASTYIQELSVTGDLQLISFTDEEIKRALAKEPAFVATVLAANTFKGQDKPITTFGSNTDVVTRDTLADEVVYGVTAAMHNRFAELVSYCPDFVQYKLPDSINPSMLAIPVHNGAIKYFKEKGLWTKAHEDRQAQLLKELNLK